MKNPVNVTEVRWFLDMVHLISKFAPHLTDKSFKEGWYLLTANAVCEYGWPSKITGPIKQY